jgi:hypothetical protein
VRQRSELFKMTGGTMEMKRKVRAKNARTSAHQMQGGGGRALERWQLLSNNELCAEKGGENGGKNALALRSQRHRATARMILDLNTLLSTS